MRWMLAGWWGLVLISLSVADNKTLQIRQKPRFYGVAVKSSVHIYCLSSRQDNSTVKWFKANKIGDEQTPLSTLIDDDIRFQMAYLYINNIQMRHSGVYYCKINETQGPGTEVKVFRPVVMEKALYRSNVKDGLIVFQGFLLAVFIAAVLLRKQKLVRHTMNKTRGKCVLQKKILCRTCITNLQQKAGFFGSRIFFKNIYFRKT
ncbi:B-cell antigen receptor complex-associated protein beta chain isoform X1 [Haplochromis burtoni]|uniref:CD79b molecule n=1 Tax=Haplochromis burtoni TaxID=8153 RepID=A0A3Q2WFU9_HAPBU|nr:B-cell antigen receptor complex-associated protein beta chain isoform X1 [Haplochromis burtoni]